jgi:hypothetical protein
LPFSPGDYPVELHREVWGDLSFPDGDPIGSSPERMGSSGRKETR